MASQVPLSAPSNFKIVVRPSHERGNANHGWLKTFHTWSFASYQDHRFMEFGCLRVLNEDRVAPNEGFGTHPHREFEIFSVPITGALKHRDSMGNVEVMKRGDIQLTSAGTGIAHSEMTDGNSEVHFLQIWASPNQRGLPPKYFTRHFSDAEKRDNLLRIVAPAGSPGVNLQREASGPTPIHSGLTVYQSVLSPGKNVTHAVTRPNAKVYVHLVQTSGYNTGPATGASVEFAGTTLREGDGAFIWASKDGELTFNNNGSKDAEFLVFDVQN